jgi:predicted CXXCH cytochrome family protein
MRRSSLVVFVVLAGIRLGYAQESDTAGFKGSGQTYTVLSEIGDPKERAAFLAAYSEATPRTRHALASTFIQTYPRSWLLAQIYDIAAKTSIDTGDYSSALIEGRFSLRLRPENPVLLVLMANVEAQKGLLEEAVTSAQDALEYLDQFDRPGNISEAEWQKTKPRLKASAYFALGRAYTASALRKDPPDPEYLAKAEDAIDHAIAWNEQDPELFYLRGLIKLRSARAREAAADFGFVARSDNPLTAQALDQLQRLRGSSSLEALLAGLPKPPVNGHLREEAELPSSAAIRSGYAGSAACQSCHPREYATWRETGMARMLREYKRENLIGDFANSPGYKDVAGEVVIRPGFNTRAYFDVRGEHGNWQRFHVDYTIGSKWQQAYATRLADGSFRVLPIQYNVLKKSWVNYWEVIDPKGSKRAIISDFPKLTSDTSYQENCAVCHTSQLREPSDSPSPANAVFREPGVNCEMCHGPSALHVEHMHKAQTNPKKLLDPPVDFRKIDNRHGVQVCAQCHRQSAIRQLGSHGEMNYSAEGASFAQKSWSRPYDAFSQRAYYKDGRFRETTFIVEAFTRSACYRKGTAQCATCHAPHVPDFSSNLASLKFKSSPNEMCLGCHEQYRARIDQHTHHPVNTEASQCVSCHMPRIVNALLFKARSHEITIPEADLTERFGQEDSPNACLLCHTEQNASWVKQNLKEWQH